MPKERVINGVTSYGFYLKKLSAHNYNEIETLLEMAGNFLDMADKKQSIGSLDNVKISIQYKFSPFLDEIETEIKLER